jgi:magnesium-transporting ATPase (P-type)
LIASVVTLTKIIFKGVSVAEMFLSAVDLAMAAVPEEVLLN